MKSRLERYNDTNTQKETVSRMSKNKHLYDDLNNKIGVEELVSFDTQTRIELTSLNYLSTMTLERAGVDLPPYHRFMSDMMEVVPAINARGYYSLEAGKYLHVEDAFGEEQKWILKYESLQYNGLFDSKNTSEIFFPYIEE